VARKKQVIKLIKVKYMNHFDKMAKGGNIQFRKLAKSKGFDIIVEEGRFEVSVDANGNPKTITNWNAKNPVNISAKNSPVITKYKSEIMNYIKGDKMANGGNVETALQNFDVHNLDSFEKQQYDMLFNRIGKEETLRILINNVEGDYSQLSPKLRALAKKYKLSQGITMDRKGNMAKGGKIKPKMVRTQFEEEEFEYGGGGKVSKSEKEKLSNLAYQLQSADEGWIKNNHGKFVEMQNQYKKQFKKVYGHTNYTDPNEMAEGGAIYKGDKVKIKDSSKKMVVKDISKGRKGYVEFSGDAGTYLKGDLEKMEKGGYTMPNNCWCYEIGGL
jgi:hypothetical protein